MIKIAMVWVSIFNIAYLENTDNGGCIVHLNYKYMQNVSEIDSTIAHNLSIVDSKSTCDEIAAKINFKGFN